MLVSIIITTRNSSSYIEKTLNAIVSQTYNNLEVIIVDDASTDVVALQKIVSKYTSSLSINLSLGKDKTNASCSRNLGMKQARGDIICFLDADDIWKENKIAVVVDTITPYGEEPVLIFHQSLRGTYDEVKVGYGNTVPTKGPTGSNIIDYLLDEQGVIQTSTISINKECARKVFFDESLPRHQDIQFCIDAYKKNVTFCFVEQILSFWIILDRTINAHTKGASIEFCLDWLYKNRNILSENNRVNYVADVLIFIAIKQRRFLYIIPTSFSLLGWKAILAWVRFLKKVTRKIIIRSKLIFLR